MKRAWRRFLSVFKKDDLDREFDEEARSHIALATDDYIQQGMPVAEAERLARVKFGSIAASIDVHRDSRGLPWLEGLAFDLRLTIRGLLRDRAFTLAAIAMLTLAIGLNVTVFAVMDAMLFRGFPLVKRNDRLVYLQERYPSGLCCISYADFEDWRAQAQSFEGMAFVGSRNISFRDGDGRPIDTVTVHREHQHVRAAGRSADAGAGFFRRRTKLREPRRLRSSTTGSGKAGLTSARTLSGRPSMSTARPPPSSA